MCRASGRAVTGCRGLSGLGVSVKKTTVNKYLILTPLAGDINGIYVEYIRIYGRGGGRRGRRSPGGPAVVGVPEAPPEKCRFTLEWRGR